MDEEPLSDGSENVSIETVMDAFLERHRRGERPNIEEYAHRHPHLADEIRATFPVMLLMEQIGDEECDGTPPASPRPPAAEQPGRIGEYQILREVGRGGMGIVYEALQETLNRRVALKVLPPLASATHRERFQREAQAAARLSHPNIVPIFAVGADAETSFFAMQFIRGEPLDRVIADLREQTSGRRRTLETSRRLLAEGSSGSSRAPFHRNVARLGARVANALAYSHAEGILHRDIKPSNLLLDAKGEIWVTDLGLAKTADSETLTDAGDVVGTLAYMSPERFNGWADPRSDVYGLGLTLYELLTLRRAFEDSDPNRLIRMISNDGPTPPRRVDPRIPRDLETIVLKAIAREPAKRYATATQMEADLERFVDGKPVLARRSRALERGWLWCRRNPVVAGLSLLVFASLVALVTVLSLSARHSQESALLLRKQLYASNIRLAQEALESGDHRLLTQLLNESPHELRGWEWNRLRWATRFATQTLRAHEDQAYALAISPDGTRYASGGNDQTLRIWDAETGTMRSSVLAHSGPFGVQTVAFAPNGQWVATGGSDNVVKLWDATSLETIRTLTGHASFVSSLSIGPNGQRLVSGSHDSTLRLWDTETGAELAERRAHEDLITAVDHDPAGRTVLSAGHDGKLHLWSAEDLSWIRTFDPPETYLQSVCFAPDGGSFAAADLSGDIHVWNLSTGRARWLGRHGDGVVCVAYDAAGKLVGSAGLDGRVHRWNVETGARAGTRHSHAGAARWVAFGPDDETVVSCGQDGLLKVRRIGCERSALRLRGLQLSDPRSAAFDPSGRFVVTGDSRGYLLTWDALTGELHDATAVPGRPVVGSVAFRADGRQLAAGCDDGTVWVRDLDAGRTWRLESSRDARAAGAIERVDYDPSSGRLVAGGSDGWIRLWDAAGATVDRPSRAFQAHVGAIHSVAFGRGGRILTAGADRSIRLWEADTGREIQAFVGHGDEVLSARFSPDAETIVSGGKDSTLILWRIADGARLRTMQRDAGWVFSVAFSPHGTRIAAGSTDGTTRLWDASTGEELITLRDAGSWVVHNAFSPDGSRLIACQRRAGSDHRRSSAFDRRFEQRAVIWETEAVPSEFADRRLAQDCEQAGDLRRAEALLDRAIEQLPDEAPLYFARARTHARSERWEAAAADHRRALELSPGADPSLPFQALAWDESWAFYLLSEMHAAAREPRRSVRALERAAEAAAGSRYHVLDQLQERRAALLPSFASCRSIDAAIADRVRSDERRTRWAERALTILRSTELDPNTASAAERQTVLFDDFETSIDSRWWSRSHSKTPDGERRFLGPFASEVVRLSMADLPAHARVRVAFRLYVIRGWKGNGHRAGDPPSAASPDVWTLAVDGGPTLLRTTFSNLREGWGDGARPQAYPGTFPEDEFRPMTGTAERSALGYRLYGDPMDSVYDLEFTFPHASDALTVHFSADGLDTTREASWGLDDVVVEILGPPAALGRDEVDRHWQALADPDPCRAEQALWSFVAAGSHGAQVLAKLVGEPTAQTNAERLAPFLARFRAAADDVEARHLQLYLEGRIHQIAGDLASAASAFETLIEQEPTWPEPVERSAECAARLERSD